MGRQVPVVARAMEQYSRLTLMALVSRTCIRSQQPLVVLLPTVTERFRSPVWFYRITPSMGLRNPAVARRTARYSSSALTALVLKAHITLPPPQVFTHLLTAMDITLMAN